MIHHGIALEVDMLTDLRLVLPNRPGTMIAALDAIARAGINVEAIAGDLRPGEMWGYLHVLVRDGSAARQAVEDAGFQVTSEHEVQVLDVDDRPGALVDAFRSFSKDGRNIETAYMANGRVVVGTEDMRRSVLGRRIEDARY